MTDFVIQLVVWLNAPANALGRLLLAPIAVLPGWLSATIAAVVSGVVLLVAFKYTSNQAAIKRVKDEIKANLLAIKLFKESASVAFGAQGAILLAALRLLVLAIVPMLVMVVPVLLILGQLSLWYQARPLEVGEQAVVILKVLPTRAAISDVRLAPIDAIDVTAGPVRVRTEREMCWKIKARRPGRHRLVFHAGHQIGEKDLVVGDRFMRVSSLRPGWDFSGAVLHPAEKPFDRNSPIQSVEIDYPARSSWTSGTDTWVVYWFAVSMISGFAFRRVLNVNM
ncbi:MAG: hypothetical protein B7Z73_13715 [Planctomycetia bacterium 21-64-5]|nr:MAG: hypothetical protein B7Z73_13715 [Planctomycetia bacterium 21-64-5]HQU47116.1 hypothetical protein [Pirellulales bacterium]